MIFSQYVDQLAQNSGCFSFDVYNQGFRRYIQAKAICNDIGAIEEIEVNPFYENIHPFALLLGETNRMFHRYTPIIKLLELNKQDRHKEDTVYFQNLYRFYHHKKIITRIKGKREIHLKVERISKIDDWLKNEKSLEGVSTYLNGEAIKISRKDFPITLTAATCNSDIINVQLDGSHRRCISYFNGKPVIKSLIINLDEALQYITEKPEPYLTKYQDKYLSVLRSF